MKSKDRFTKYPTPEGLEVRNLFDYLMQGGADKPTITMLSEEYLTMIRDREDCADFRLSWIVRMMYAYRERLPEQLAQEAMEELLKFPYEDCGGHGMCTWTENHRLYIDGTEYLTAQLAAEGCSGSGAGERSGDRELRFADGRSAAEHMSRARAKLTAQLRNTERFGFAEWESCNYYSETISALSNLIQFVADGELTALAVSAMDMLLYDICSQTSYNGGFIFAPASSRAYVDNKVSAREGNYLTEQLLMLTGERPTFLKEKECCFRELLDATDERGGHIYEPPAECVRMLREVMDTDAVFTPRETALVQGLPIAEYDKLGSGEERVRYAFTAGAMSDHRLICGNMRYLCETGLIDNTMLKALSGFKNPLLYRTGLLGLIKRFVPVTWDGAAMEQGRIYTYNAGRYSMSAAFDYRVGLPLFQQFSLIANLSYGVSIFATDPYRSSERSGSPDYWVGSAEGPQAAAFRNVGMCLFDPAHARFGHGITHLFFPVGRFDEVDLTGLSEGILFGRTSGVNICVRTNPGVHFVPIGESRAHDMAIRGGVKIEPDAFDREYDLINDAEGLHYYILEIDDTCGLDEFIARMAVAGVVTRGSTVCYHGADEVYTLAYRGDFTVGGRVFEPDFVPLRTAAGDKRGIEK